jgi:hypothetical protein
MGDRACAQRGQGAVWLTNVHAHALVRRMVRLSGTAAAAMAVVAACVGLAHASAPAGGRDVDIVPCVDIAPAWTNSTDLSKLVLAGHENQYSVFACRFASGGDVLPGKMGALFNCCERHVPPGAGGEGGGEGRVG